MRGTAAAYVSFLGLIFGVASCRTPDSGSAVKSETGTFQAPASWPFELGEQEYVDEEGNDEAFWVERLVEQSDKTVAGLKQSTGSARRSAHSKAHGCVTGTFELHSDRPAESKFGMFKQDGTYPVWIRFSNAMAAVQSDVIPDGRGMAIKVLGDFGPKILPGQEQSNGIDFPFVSGPVFPVANVKDYLDLQQNGAAFLAANPKAGLLALDVAKRVMKSPLLGTYWSMGAYKLGPRAVKFATRPCVAPLFNVPLSIKPNFLREAMIHQLETKEKEACFEFGVQFQKNPTTMPVEDPTVEWRESASFFSSVERPVSGDDPVSPFLPVATIRIPAQEFSSKAQDEFCERMSFNPWRTLAEQRPLGNLMRARLKVYTASLKERLKSNGDHPAADVLTGTAADVTK